MSAFLAGLVLRSKAGSGAPADRGATVECHSTISLLSLCMICVRGASTTQLQHIVPIQLVRKRCYVPPRNYFTTCSVQPTRLRCRNHMLEAMCALAHGIRMSHCGSCRQATTKFHGQPHQEFAQRTTDMCFQTRQAQPVAQPLQSGRFCHGSIRRCQPPLPVLQGKATASVHSDVALIELWHRLRALRTAAWAIPRGVRHDEAQPFATERTLTRKCRTLKL